MEGDIYKLLTVWGETNKQFNYLSPDIVDRYIFKTEK